jgi:hypothetical protein
MAACLSDDEMLALARGALPLGARPTVEGHLQDCRDCRSLAAEAARGLYESITATAPAEGSFVPRPTPQSLIPGELVSRYRIIGAIGAGGSGVVYEAFDPQLGRKIALKMVRPDSDGHGPARLLREAQAMARLAHPNVVAVHDAGTFGGQVFVAMELVEGRTLARWLEEAQHPWWEIVRVFLEAGTGLAAAHAAGLIHRDFKPENVLVGRDGRVRVTDFGLARTSDGGPDVEAPAGDHVRVIVEPVAERRLLTVTAPGARAGTPAYMAPEQFQGARADERTDQFNFSSALWKALYRQRPFGTPGTDSLTMTTLAREVIAGQLREPPPSEVPAGVQAILRRGLSRQAADRFPSMSDLLGALAKRVPARSGPRRPLWGLGAMAALAILAVVGALVVRPGRRETTAPIPAVAVAPEPAPPAPPPDRVVTETASPVRPAPRPRREARPVPGPRPARYGSRLKDPFAATP